MARAIVTFARGWHSLAITRSLGRQGIEVYCGEEAPFAPCFFSRYCTGHFQYPSASKDPEGFIEFMAETVQQLKPPGDEPYVLMPVHKETWLIAKHRERFEPHIRVPLTSYENMIRTHDKGQLAQLAEELGIRTPKTRQFTRVDDVYRAVPDLSFPLFVKTRAGSAGVGLKKVRTPEELTATFKEFVEGFNLAPEDYPLIQEFVEGDDYCVTVLFDRGRCVARMTYHNVRAFPRDTGAGAVRESVELPEAEEAAVTLLSHLNWHGIAELDFRRARGGPAYLIELNPRFFGGLHQAVAANVDYPHLLFRVACGEEITEAPPVDYSVRTESPVVGLLATLDEIAHDDRLLGRFRRVRDELGGRARAPDGDSRLRSFWKALREAANPHDLKAYFKEMFSVHRHAINDVLQADDPMPAMGFLFPLALMLKHGKISMGVLTSEDEIATERPRRRFRDLLRHPRWRVLTLTAVLFALSVFAINAPATRDNLGWIVGLPSRLAARVFGELDQHKLGTLGGALRHTAYHALNLLFLFVVASLVFRQRPVRGKGSK